MDSVLVTKLFQLGVQPRLDLHKFAHGVNLAGAKMVNATFAYHL